MPNSLGELLRRVFSGALSLEHNLFNTAQHVLHARINFFITHRAVLFLLSNTMLHGELLVVANTFKELMPRHGRSSCSIPQKGSDISPFVHCCILSRREAVLVLQRCICSIFEEQLCSRHILAKEQRRLVIFVPHIYGIVYGILVL